MTDLARLVVALEAQTEKYQRGLDQANRKLEKFQRDQNTRLAAIGKRFDRFAGGVRGALAAVGVGLTFRAIIKATSEAEAAFAQLEDAVRQTGGTAGFTAQQLADYAGELQKISTFGDEEIQNLEQVLLRFRSIQGDNFTRTTAAVLDLATVLKIDLTAAAKLVGTALEDPATGMSQLRRYGIVLSEQLQKNIKDLGATGHQAEAQAILLDELEKRYKGAAAAARDNFGGALKGLKNAFGDLLEGKSGMQDATDAINDLTDTLNSPEVKEGFATLVSGFIQVVEWAAKATTYITGLTKFLAEEFGSKFGVAGDDLVRMSDRIIELRKEIAHLEDVSKNGNFFQRYLEGFERGIDSGIANYTKQLKDLEAQYEEARKAAEQAAAAQSGGIKVPKPGEFKQLQPGQKPGEDALTEVKVTAQKIESYVNSYTKFLEQADKATQTEVERINGELDDFVGNLDALYAEHIISLEEYNARYLEKFDELVPEVEVKAKKVGDALKKNDDQLSEFALQAQRNLTDILATGFEDAMQGSFDNILVAFAKMIDQMVAQALAAQVAEKLFGTGKGSGGFGNGLIGKGLDLLGGLFGGSRDSGGRGSPGKVYRIGTGAQPEYFAPDTPGSFFPRGEGLAGMARGVTQIFKYEKPPTARTSAQMQRDSVRGQALAARLL